MGLFLFWRSCIKKANTLLNGKGTISIVTKKYREGKASQQEIENLEAYYNLYDAKPDVTEMLSTEENDFLKKSDQIRA